jgi:hypothetical protein
LLDEADEVYAIATTELEINSGKTTKEINN